MEMGSSLPGTQTKDFYNSAYLPAVIFKLDSLLQGLDLFESSPFFLRGDIVFELCCPGQRPGRVAEGKNIGKADLPQDCESCLEVFLRLAREADDNVRAQADLRHEAAEIGNFFQVFFSGVASSHFFQSGG